MKLPRVALLYLPLLLFFIGFVMNALVLVRNNQQMPVYMPGGCDLHMFDDEDEMLGRPIHTCMTPKTHLKILADWIFIRHIGIASPGDFFEWAGEILQIPFQIIFLGLWLNDRAYFGV